MIALLLIGVAIVVIACLSPVAALIGLLWLLDEGSSSPSRYRRDD